MAIVQSCQVQMIKNLEVVGAFSAKKFFPEKIFFDDLQPPPRRQKKFGKCTILGVQKFFGHTQIFRDIIQIFQISQKNTISHKIDRICPIIIERSITYRTFKLLPFPFSCCIATHFPAFKKDSLVFRYIFMQINANKCK